MAVSLSANLQRQPSISCRTKINSGMKLQQPGFLGTRRQNSTAEFFDRVHKSLHCGFGWIGRVRMMPLGTPRVPVKNPGDGSWQWVDIWNALYRERIIFIGQPIDEEFGNQILATMLYLDSIDNGKRLYMYINGPGGEITPSLSIYDTMRTLKSPITTHCIGMAYNMATFILAAGEKGNRTAKPRIRIGLENPAGAARGQAADVENEAKELVRIKDYIHRELSKNTGQPIERIARDLRYLKRFDADEALEYGLIDRIVRPPPITEERKYKSAGLG